MDQITSEDQIPKELKEAIYKINSIKIRIQILSLLDRFNQKNNNQKIL